MDFKIEFMKIKEIKINNFRGFRNKNSISFQNNVNVFIGINGAGKSSLLDLIAIFLNQFAIKISGNSEAEHSLNNLDINIFEQETSNQIYLTVPPLNNLFSGILPINHHTISWKIVRNFYENKNNYSQLNGYIEDYISSINSNSNHNIPILRYFQPKRISNETKKYSGKRKRYSSKQFQAYDGAFNKSVEFNKFVDWFIEEENIENREKIIRKDFDYNNPNLEVIRKAIFIFFLGFKTNKYNNFRVENRAESPKLTTISSLVIDKNDETFNLEQLSDGEKIIILTVSDIAYRLSIANPNSQNALNCCGIVLIDEIDLHLHPSWQRAFIPRLTATFQNIQFFITSHSPQVIGSVNKENVFRIDNFKIENLKAHTRGRDSNSLLRDVFDENERDIEFKEKIKLLYNYIENNDKENAKKQLNELTKYFGDRDTEIVRANMYYEDLID